MWHMHVPSFIADARPIDARAVAGARAVVIRDRAEHRIFDLVTVGYRHCPFALTWFYLRNRNVSQLVRDV